MECPLCYGECKVFADSQNDTLKFVCSTYNRSFMVSSSVNSITDDNEKRRVYNLIFEHVIRKPYADEQKTFWHYFYEPDYLTSERDKTYYVNVAEIPYPKKLSERIDRILLNLYCINSSYGYDFFIDETLAKAFFFETKEEEESLGCVFLLEELNYLTKTKDFYYRIAAKGWQRIEELLRQYSAKKQAFIALSFKPETDNIRNAFKEGIKKAGYSSMAIDEKEHNGQIVPEIFDEIDKSIFLVMDVTYPNYGAYYEAGYALGKGKEVIVCCRQDVFEDQKMIRPHFDIAQKSMIIWKTEKELSERLTQRIVATVK